MEFEWLVDFWRCCRRPGCCSQESSQEWELLVLGGPLWRLLRVRGISAGTDAGDSLV